MQIQLITMFSRCIDGAETTVFDSSAEKEPSFGVTFKGWARQGKRWFWQ